MPTRTGTRAATLTAKEAAFLDNPFVGVVTTVRRDGSLHSTVVWVDHDEEDVLFNTARGRAKPRHLERDPRIAIAVVDPSDPYRWLAAGGRAELIDEGADEHIDKLAKKYLGQDGYPFRQPGEQRVIVHIEADHLESSGLD
jgi:PPOX class probable F420-dependent enzyme